MLTHVSERDPGGDGFTSQRPVTQSFDVFFDLRLNKRLTKQSRRRWLETPSRSLWRHCDEFGVFNSAMGTFSRITFSSDPLLQKPGELERFIY